MTRRVRRPTSEPLGRPRFEAHDDDLPRCDMRTPTLHALLGRTAHAPTVRPPGRVRLGM